MAAITLNTAVSKCPVIYAYSLPEVPKRSGWVKIGYTEGDVEKRIKQQTHTAGLTAITEWCDNAVFEGSNELFRDTDFHAYLRRNNVESEKGNEWFHISGEASEKMFFEFRKNRGHLESRGVIPYTLRPSQREAVAKTLDYFSLHKNGEFLWNAKPRFGKSLCVYDLCKQLGAESVLILTNRPAIAKSWLDDYNRFLGEESGLLFVSEVDTLKNECGFFTRKEFVHRVADGIRLIEFVSLQDLKGSIYFGGRCDKLREVAEQPWDLLVLDEAHEGVDTIRSEIALDKIKRKYTLHLSGTPFKALANEKFPADAIFNWTYADEQRAKQEWHADGEAEENPYAEMPRLNMFTYQMSEIVRDEAARGMQIEGRSAAYAFDLNEFFSVNEAGRFKYNDSVDRFLDALTTQEKFPFSTDDLRKELKHTLWLLERVESARALARKLQKHPVFGAYEIVLAAGDGRIDDDDETDKALKKVTEAIKKHDRTITLSVGQLTTGVTVPEWAGVLMLSNVKSPALYMQAAFRAQNPCLYRCGRHKFLRKQNAYIFDFDPCRTLIIFEQFANGLYPETKGSSDGDIRQQRVRELLNFFPVIGEDEGGEMIALDAAKVLSIPRKLKSQEVVRRGFMCDYLFQNISNVFRAPQAVVEILNSLTAVKNKKLNPLPADIGKGMRINEEGESYIPKEQAIGTATDLFGEKIYKDIDAVLGEITAAAMTPSPQPEEIGQAVAESIKESFRSNVTTPLIETAAGQYGSGMSKAVRNDLERRINNQADAVIKRAVAAHKIEQNRLQADFNRQIEEAETDHEAENRKKAFEAKSAELTKTVREELTRELCDLAHESGNRIVETVETQKAEAVKRTREDEIRDRLRGFSRTIPSFLMAYGSGKNITLKTFDKDIPDNVFREVTSISLAQFRFLRDGGAYTNPETGEEAYFNGNLFDPLVFDDAVRDFMAKKAELADYFDEGNKEDIFDYIPPQQTNQIFTPKAVVKKMVDLLEEENPGCFDDPQKTFIDLYMKSGLFITEIVKHLYNSRGLKAAYPDARERLKHIFAEQVYGLAPTEIIYRIAESYILGFDEAGQTIKHNLKQADALPYAKEGRLDELLEELYG